MQEAVNIHGTAIAVGTAGLLFLGPSGIGKSSLAFACLASAKQLGLPSALIADDRVLVSRRDGTVIAECPPSIAGLIEIRGTGILTIGSIPAQWGLKIPIFSPGWVTDRDYWSSTWLPGSDACGRTLVPVGNTDRDKTLTPFSVFLLSFLF